MSPSVGQGPTVAELNGDALKVQFHESGVAETWVEDVNPTDGFDGERVVKDNPQNGNIVKGEVLDDVGSADADEVENPLKVVEAEVVSVADGLDEAEVREESISNELAHRERRRIIDESRVHHKNQTLFLGEGAQFLDLSDGLSGRLGDHDVLTALERLAHKLEVRFGRSDDGDRVNIIIPPKLIETSQRLESPLSVGLVDTVGVLVESIYVRERRVLAKVSQDFASPPSQSQDGGVESLVAQGLQDPCGWKARFALHNRLAACATDATCLPRRIAKARQDGAEGVVAAMLTCPTVQSLCLLRV